MSRLDFFLASLLSLYLEILLIRFLGTEIRIFAYFSNLVLVVCFLGLGLGYASRRLRLGLAHGAWLVALLVLSTHPWLEPLGFRRISEALAWTDVNTWTLPTAETAVHVLGFARLALLLLVVAAVFIPLGRLLGDGFECLPRRLAAYSLNVAGSLAGIWLFAALSFAHLPPWAWIAVAGSLALWLTRASLSTLLSVALAYAVALTALFTVAPGDGETTWSAYHKLVLRQLGATAPPMYTLEVNNTLYQYVLPLSDDVLDRSREPLPRDARRFFYYNLPYQLHGTADEVLVVGAGTGNDVAAALRNGAERVDAVEIDQAIVDIGRRVHPERPYADPRVRVIVDDARAFFRKTHHRYDLIVFGLLDSHRLTSNHSNTNLDSYVYTVESLREAQGLLRPGGAIVLAFQTFYPYIGWRLHDALERASGTPPLVLWVRPGQSLLQGTGGTVFFSGDRARLESRRVQDPALDRALDEYEQATPEPFRRSAAPGPVVVATDDWPYLYVEKPRIPSLWLAMIGLTSALALAGLPAAGLSLRRIDGHFFFLGAAFLFLETYTITRAQLFFGATWLVSAIVITAILSVILIGNAIVIRHGPLRRGACYAALLAAALLPTWVAPGRLLGLGPGAGASVSAALAALPIAFAAVIFGGSFSRAADPRRALASNLLGAVAGGLIQCVSFVTGLRAIAILAALFYALSWAFAARGARNLAE